MPGLKTQGVCQSQLFCIFSKKGVEYNKFLWIFLWNVGPGRMSTSSPNWPKLSKQCHVPSDHKHLLHSFPWPHIWAPAGKPMIHSVSLLKKWCHAMCPQYLPSDMPRWFCTKWNGGFSVTTDFIWNPTDLSRNLSFVPVTSETFPTGAELAAGNEKRWMIRTLVGHKSQKVAQCDPWFY